MSIIKILCTVLLVVSSSFLVVCRSYNNGLIFYNLENHQTYLPPTISVSRGRGLAKFQYSSRGSIWSTFGKPCDCEGPLCGCCVGIKVKQYNFEQKMCANVSYVPRYDEIQMEVFLNDTATAKYGIAARNPSPLCVPIMMGIPMSMCIQMSNIGVQGDNLNMCMDFLVRLASTELFEMHFQCMKVGLQGASWVGANGQPVIPANEGKIKDRISNESEEYYDEESEVDAEKEIISKEKELENELMNMQEEDVNKAEEEMDSNDITGKIMNIVKEQEHEENTMKGSEELMKENEIEGLSPIYDNEQVEKIVTNIMESINEAKDSEDTETSAMTIMESMQDSNVLSDIRHHEKIPIALKNEESDMESIMETNALNDSATETTKLKESETESLQLEINDVKATAVNHLQMDDSSETIKDNTSFEDLSNNSMPDELHLDDLHKNSQETQLQMENNVEQPQKQSHEIMKDMFVPTLATQDSGNIQNESNMETLEETYAETTENISDDLESANIEKFEMFINNGSAEETTEINKIDNQLNNSLKIPQQSAMKTSTEHSMAANLRPTMPQIAATTSETDGVDSIDNVLTTATIITTTTTTATKKPTVLDENLAAAVTLIENTDDDDKTNNRDDENEDNTNVDGDNSHENDSDYDDDEESDETEDETTEKGIETNDVFTAVVMPTTAVLKHENVIYHIESSETQQLPNASNSNESNSNDETNENTKDEFEAENDEEENADKEPIESNEQNENDAEEEYDDEFEDYETTTAKVAISDTKHKIGTDTCCKSSTPVALNIMQATAIKKHDDNTNTAEMPQTNTATNNSLQFVSNTNSMVGSTDSNTLNVKSTTNKMSQITANPAAATIAVSTTSNSNAMPLPLARKLLALQRQQQQYQQYHHRHSHLRQHYV